MVRKKMTQSNVESSCFFITLGTQGTPNSRHFIFILFIFLTIFFSYGQDGLINLPLYEKTIDSVLKVEVSKFKQDSALKLLLHEIEILKTDASLTASSWGICVMNNETGNILAEYNSQQSLVPASTLKLVTSGAALSILGPDYRFPTTLQYDGKIDKNGFLNGNLYILGGGDPAFGSIRMGNNYLLDTVFKNWLSILKERNIRQVSGTVIADADIFDDILIPGGWLWIDIGNYYGAGASGLNVMENKYNVWFRPGSGIGNPAPVVRIDPDIPGIEFINRVTTAGAGTGDQVYIFGSPYTYLRFCEGTVPKGNDFPVRGSVPDPPYLCAAMFYKYLIQNGIEVCEEPSTMFNERLKGRVHKDKRKDIAVFDQSQLSALLVPLNNWSINLYTECLLKMIGKVQKNNGSYYSGTTAIREFLIEKEVPLDGFVMEDGSGLSFLNRISTFQMAKILSVYSRESDFEYLFKSIPLAGNSGTMTYVLKGTQAEGRLRAKSGSLKDVKSYAGYIRNKEDELLSFSIIINNFEGSSNVLQKKLERLMLLISGL